MIVVAKYYGFVVNFKVLACLGIEQSNFQLGEQTKLKTSVSELSDQMRGDLDPVQLGDNILSYLMPHLNTLIGSFYVCYEDQLLKLVSTYAHSNRKNLANKYEFGESLVGQAALERKNIAVKNIPDNYIKISSGLGEDIPGSIFVMPIFFEKKVQGILEIGSFKELTDAQISFLDQVNGGIGISLNGSLARIKMKALLEETQQQAKELESQQEELRTSNEELEEQTVALKESEAKLKAQREELRQTNEELEEQGKNLIEKK